MAQNPHQGPSPHMFGNYNGPPNSFPQMAPQMGMQRPMPTPGNPNLPMIQHSFPSQQYPNMQMTPNTGVQNQNQPPGRPREWQNHTQQLPYERDSKRPRPYPANPNDPTFPPNHSASMPPMQQMQQQMQPQQQVAMNPNQMHNPFVQHGQPMPRMQPAGNPSLQMNQPHAPFSQNQNHFRSPGPMPGPQMNDNDPRNPYQYSHKPDALQQGQPPVQQNAFERNTVIQNKEFNKPNDPRASHKHTNNNEDSSDEAEQKQDEILSFKDFLAKQPDSISPEDAKAAYDRYVMEFTTRKPNRFFDLHKDEEWFKERYYPEYVTARIVRVREEVQERAKVYREIWSKGGSLACAPSLSASSDRRQKSDPRNKRHDREKKDKGNESPSDAVERTVSVDEKPDEKMVDNSVQKTEDSTSKSDAVMTEMPQDNSTKKSEDAEHLTELPKQEDEKTNTEKINTNETEEKSDEHVISQTSDQAKSENDTTVNAKEEDITKEQISEKLESSDTVKTDLVLASVKDEDKVEAPAETSISQKAESEIKPISEKNDSPKMEENIKSEDVTCKQEDQVLPDRKEEQSNDSADKKPQLLEDSKENASEEVKMDDSTLKSVEPLVEKNDDTKGEIPAESNDHDVSTEYAEGEISQDEDEATCTNPELMLPLRKGHQENTIFLRGIPTNLSREALTAVLRKGPDGGMDLKFRRLKLGDINPQRRLERFGWAVYASEQDASFALETVKGVVVRTKKSETSEEQSGSNTKDDGEENEDPNSVYEIDCMVNLQRRKKYNQGKVLPSAFSTSSRMAHDVEQSVKIMRFLDKLRLIENDLNPLSDEFLQELESDAKRLDHIVTYLREVHYYCYYSGNEFLEDPTSMPPQELRPATARETLPSDADNRILKRVDERASWVFERDYDRPRSNSDNGETAKEEAIAKWLDANTKNEGHGRFRCGLPPHKLFKGPEFVHKHLRTKHADKMKKIRMKAIIDTYRANFENDPSKKEVIEIYNEGSTDSAEGGKPSRGRHSDENPGGRRGHGFSQGNGDFQRTQVPVGMYNATAPFLGMGVQPFPMMMMSTPGFPAGYAGAPGYPNAMNFGGGPMNNSMGSNGMMGMKGEGRRHRRDRDFRDGGYRGGNRGNRSGGKRGGHGRRNGDRRHRNDDKQLDPRASGPRRSYNDLDAPANGPSFDLMRYDDDV